MLIIISLIFILTCFYFDNSIVQIVSLLRNNLLDNFFLVVTFVSSEILIFFILTTLFLWTENKREWIFPLWTCMGLSLFVSFFLKIVIHRLRPFQIGLVELISNLQNSSYEIWNFSFPSFQSMLVFSVIPIISYKFPRLKKFWIIFAVLVAFSRIYFGVHFFSDILFGILIGYLIGFEILNLEKKKKFGQKFYKKVFKR